MDHCCTSHHYFLCIKKCAEAPCPKGICKPTRLSEEVFKELHQFPDPVPQPDGHYKPFDGVVKQQKNAGLSYKFHDAIKAPSTLKKENVRDIVKCMECSKPRTVHSVVRESCQRKMLSPRSCKMRLIILFVEIPCLNLINHC